MNVIVCGAGTVGSYAAEVLTAAGHNVTVVDDRPERLAQIEENLDVRTLTGNCANAEVLRDAGANSEDAALVAATHSDEINLLTASVAKGLGAGKSIARVHHSAYFSQRGLDYAKHLGIDRLICPEYSAALALASSLRNPAAITIENYASGQIEMQQILITPDAPVVGRTVVELMLPKGVRLAAIRRGSTAFLPLATTEIKSGDQVVLVGNTQVFQEGRRQLQKTEHSRRSLILMGGTSTAVWLCRAINDRSFSIRLFEADRERAEELAEKLDGITVLHADPTDQSVFEEERVAEADAFVGLSNDDDHNILGCAWAKSAGVSQVLTVVQQARYLHLLKRVGLDQIFVPRIIAVRQIERSLNDSPLFRMSSLAEGVLDVYRVKIGPKAQAIGNSLRELHLTPDWMVAAIHRKDKIWVPAADDVIEATDTITAIGRHGQEERLHRVFGV